MSIIRVQIIFILIISFSIFSSSYAQDEFEELSIDSVTSCAPESLDTIYDQYKQEDLDIFQIKKWYSFGSEYFKQEEYTSALPSLSLTKKRYFPSGETLAKASVEDVLIVSPIFFALDHEPSFLLKLIYKSIPPKQSGRPCDVNMR